MHHYRLAVAASLLCAAASAQVLAVSPADRAGLEGSSFTHFPLGRASARMQTLHGDLPPHTLISGHAYRRDAIQVRGQVDAFSSDLQVTLSMSPNGPTQASTTFANNRGSNPVVVLPRTMLAFPATQRPPLDPAATFELVVPYAVPFLLPSTQGTLCVEVEVFGNQSASGPNQNLSIYLDAHENYTNGQAEQPGYRTGAGCAAPGATAACFATMTLWRRTTGLDLDVALRNAVGSATGSSLPLLILGLAPLAGVSVPGRPDCPFHNTGDAWFLLPGAVNAAGSWDGTLAGLALLPPGLRLWCQVGSIDLATGALAASDATTVVVPPPGPVPVPVSRIVNSTSQSATTGTVSYAVPVMGFL